MVPIALATIIIGFIYLAPVAQGIEHAPPERGAQVRILPGALTNKVPGEIGATLPSVDPCDDVIGEGTDLGPEVVPPVLLVTKVDRACLDQYRKEIIGQAREGPIGRGVLRPHLIGLDAAPDPGQSQHDVARVRVDRSEQPVDPVHEGVE